MLKNFGYSITVNNLEKKFELIDTTRSIMNKYIDRLVKPENMNNPAQWMLSQEFKENYTGKNKALSVLRLLANSLDNEDKKLLSKLEREFYILGHMFANHSQQQSQEDWAVAVQQQSKRVTDALNGLLQKCEWNG